jgi:hypothetical protein
VRSRWPVIRVAALATTLALAASARLEAQLNSVPVIYSPPPGLERPARSLYLQFGFGSNDDSGQNFAVAAQGSLGFGRYFTVGAGIATLNPKDAAGERSLKAQGMVNLSGNLRPYLSPDGRTSVMVGLQLGLGFVDGPDDAWEIDLPLGAAAALSFHLAGLALETWIMPRYSAYRVHAVDEGAWQHGPGLSFGVTVGSPLGTGLMLAFDWSDRSQETSGGVSFADVSPIVWSVGLRHRLP